MERSLSDRLDVILARISLAASAAALIISATGGFSLSLSGLRLSVRQPGRALEIAVVAGLLAWLAARRVPDGARDWWPRLERLAPWLAGAAALWTLAIGIRAGTFVAGGADSYGYVSQAALWAAGHLQIQQPIATSVPWPAADWTFTPLGYRPGVHPGSIVPWYPPGLSLIMAVSLKLAGPGAQFYVVPALGAAAVWLTFILGRRVAGPWAGGAAALVLASSPIFVYQLVQPMSDVPVTTWWLAALCLVAGGGPLALVAGGVFASMAVLTRPNLVPLAVVLAVVAALSRGREDRSAWSRLQRALWFAFGLAPGCLLLGLLQFLWYGSPLRSGYGELEFLFGWANIPVNLARYARWLLETETPFVLLALASPFVSRLTGVSSNAARASLIGACAAIILVVLGSYLPYRPYEAWSYLRFLLPALPSLLVLSAAVAIPCLRRLPGTLGPVALALMVASLVVFGLRTATDREAFALRQMEQRYVEAAGWVVHHLPDRAVVLTFQHSGSLRYYSGRLTMRWDQLEPDWLDQAIAVLRQRGYAPYILLESGEEAIFRTHFSGMSPLAALDWEPVATLPSAVSSTVRIYDPADAGLPKTR